MQSALNTNVENYKGPTWPKPYRGYYYIPWEDYDDDVCKIFHEIYYRDDRVKRNLQVKAPSWFENLTPYSYPSQQDFERAVNECLLENEVLVYDFLKKLNEENNSHQ
jgi:hypothetical protein